MNVFQLYVGVFQCHCNVGSMWHMLHIGCWGSYQGIGQAVCMEIPELYRAVHIFSRFRNGSRDWLIAEALHAKAVKYAILRLCIVQSPGGPLVPSNPVTASEAESGL
jgi:hypothetical protein